MVLSPDAVLQEAELIEINRIGDSEAANEFKEYFATFGPKIFASLKGDRRLLNQKGTEGKVVREAHEMGWAKVMKATSPTRPGLRLVCRRWSRLWFAIHGVYSVTSR